MALNRYRLKHLQQQGHKGALRAGKLLARPDRLIGLILIGNNLVNILASSIATVVAIQLYGDAGIAIATILLTMVILIFAEITPKTIAAIHPEKSCIPGEHHSAAADENWRCPRFGRSMPSPMDSYRFLASRQTRRARTHLLKKNSERL